MLQPGRQYSAGTSYRYGFNGKERDKDIAADNYDFGARIYDGRIGRWLSVDPLQAKYTAFSPYNFCINNPLIFMDYDGRDIIIVTSSGNFKIAKETLLKTPSGKALWNKYAKSKSHDIYIKVGKVEDPTIAMANTNYGFVYDEKKFDLSDLVKDGKIHVKDKGWKVVDEFENVDISKSKGRRLSFIVLNEDIFDEKKGKVTSTMKVRLASMTHLPYELAETFFHELKAHIDLYGSKDEHKAYGKAVGGVFREDYLPAPNTPAEKIKNELYDEYLKGFKDDPRPKNPKKDTTDQTIHDKA